MDVSLINPDVWKELYTPRSRVGEFKRDNTLRVLDKDGSGIADEDIMEHTRHRRMLSHAFSEKALRGQEGIMQNLVDMLISGLKLHIKKHSSEPVNMTKKYNWATFDVIGDLAFGQPFGCLEADSPHYVISMVNDLFYHMIRTQPFKRFPLLQPFQSLIASPSNAITNVQKFEKFAFETIKKRIENGDAGRKDFISYMQPHNSTGEFTEAELTSNAAALMIAGSETTATTLTAGTYFLLKNPSVYQRLVQEIRSSFKEEKDITISELDNLPYLAAVLTETLRIFPPVPGIMTRVIPKEGKHLCGYWLPGKVRYFLDILGALMCLAESCTFISIAHQILYRRSFPFLSCLHIIQNATFYARRNSSLHDGWGIHSSARIQKMYFNHFQLGHGIALARSKSVLFPSAILWVLIHFFI